jgi:beta-glucosidase
MFATGVIDDPPQKSVIDIEAHLAISQRLAEQSMVLLKNDKQQLPLDGSKIRSIAIIGSHADIGMLSGGGSAQVDPPGGNVIMPPGKRGTVWGKPVWFPSSPLRAIRAKNPSVKVTYDPGTDLESAAARAKGADVAIIFASRWETEGADAPNLDLPENQNALISRVAAANPNTIVVLVTGNPIAMPWLPQVNAVLQAWFAGNRGADAVANILFGDINPSGKLPITFPKSEADLAHKIFPEPPGTQPADNDPDAWKKRLDGLPAFQAHYDEGLKVGYKWFDAEKKPVLFAFGHGLSYTTYAYSDLKASMRAGEATVSFTVRNTGRRAGSEIAQVYVGMPASAGEPPKRLVGWTKVKLDPGEAQNVTITVEPLFLSVFDSKLHRWQLPAGDYTFLVGGSSDNLPLKQTVHESR